MVLDLQVDLVGHEIVAGLGQLLVLFELPPPDGLGRDVLDVGAVQVAAANQFRAEHPQRLDFPHAGLLGCLQGKRILHYFRKPHFTEV